MSMQVASEKGFFSIVINVQVSSSVHVTRSTLNFKSLDSEVNECLLFGCRCLHQHTIVWFFIL